MGVDRPTVRELINPVFTLYSRLGANERSQAALERSSQDACDVIRLTRAARRLRGQ